MQGLLIDACMADAMQASLVPTYSTSPPHMYRGKGVGARGRAENRWAGQSEIGGARGRAENRWAGQSEIGGARGRAENRWAGPTMINH